LTGKLDHAQRGGVAVFIVLGFMMLAVGVLPQALSLSSTLTRDSQVKTDILLRHYTAISGEQHARFRVLHETGFLDTLAPEVPLTQTISLNGRTVTITITALDTGQGEVIGTKLWADIVLALDVSGSVSSSELVLLKDAAVDIVDHLDLKENEDGVRVGVSRFRGSSQSVVVMTDVDDPDAVPADTPIRDGINGLVQGGPGLSSGTDIVAGLAGAAAQFATGLGDRASESNLIVMITDGDDSAGNSLEAIAAASLATGAEVFVVGVGDGIDISTLNAIATDDDPADPDYNPADVNAGHRFYTSDFSGLFAIIDGLAEAVIASAQNRLIRIVSQAGGNTVESLISLDLDGNGNLESWNIR
jgi:hypothetical protein